MGLGVLCFNLAGHEELILYPQAPGLGPFRLRIEAGEGERDLRLRSEDAGFERVVPEARPLA